MRTGVIAKPVKSLLALVLAGLFASASNAAIFEDGEARRAILELRQRVDSMQAAQQKAADEHRQDTEQLRRILLDLQNQIEVLRVEQAKLRGQNEQLIRDVADLQRRQKDIAQGVDERLSKFEPVKVTLDGQEFQADPAEKRDFEAALAVFRSGKFAEANTAFASFVRQYPRSGYGPSARFWLGNAQYAQRDHKEAIGNCFRMRLRTHVHPRRLSRSPIASWNSKTTVQPEKRWKIWCAFTRNLKPPLLPKNDLRA